MCGIAGLFTPGREVKLDAVMPMLQALAHRGPDGQGHFVEQDIALLHARLSIIDLAHGQQPLFSQSRQKVLVANGEIYNHIELRNELTDQGVVFSSQSDCEVMLPLAERSPDRFMSQLNGMFAVALFDRESRTLSLFRDRFGIKPLYYMELPGGVAFASEIKALLPVMDDTADLDQDAIGRFLQINFTSGNTTALGKIKRLEPGYTLTVDFQGRTTIKSWWSLSDELQRQPLFDGSLPEAVEQFDQLLNRSLTQHLRSDVPVGLFLSGGIDSSILATQLSRLPSQSGVPKAWSLGFDTQSVQDESTAAAEIAKASGIELELIRVEPVSLFDHLVYAIWASDELMGDFAALPTLLLAEAAASSHKVVLTGEGGDEVFAGYGRYRMPKLQRWLHSIRSPGTAGFRTRGRFDKALPAALLKKEFRCQMRAQWRQPFIDAWQQSTSLTDLQRQQYTDMQTWLVDDLLTKADRMLMVQGVEGRVPFLDHELVVFGLSLPAAFKIQGRTGKQVPRAWLQLHQPSINSMGRKRGFSVPVEDWVQSLDRDELLLALARSSTLQHIIDKAALAAALKHSGPLDKTLIEPLAALIQFAIWSKLFVEQPGKVPPRKAKPIEWLLQ